MRTYIEAALVAKGLSRLGPPFLLEGLSLKGTFIEAWKTKLVAGFYTALILLIAAIVLFWVIPRVWPKKKKRNRKLSKIAIWILALALLLMFFSLFAGIGFGLGLGKGKGAGVGSGTGIGIGKGETNERKQYVTEGELDVAITGCTVYLDAEEVPIDKVQDEIVARYKDSLKVVLIDNYSDYGTYKRVAAILGEMFADGSYEKRKEN